ncbi:hypothetical protein DFR68_103300 [Nocardia mexicana]|uniref:Uncharacterized protein n=1 Tax=Nocardia mexicana TaxID=279262 RepID=A0A370HDG6_9NOCA|nr:hypothetical protein DFR68_103300 [Nocardia mexicana]
MTESLPAAVSLPTVRLADCRGDPSGRALQSDGADDCVEPQRCCNDECPDFLGLRGFRGNLALLVW